MEARKILFASIPADGHFNPMTGMAMELKNQGHDIRWYTSEIFDVAEEILQSRENRYNSAFETTHR